MAYELLGDPPITSGDRTAASFKTWNESVNDAFQVVQWAMARLAGVSSDFVLDYGDIGADSLKVEAQDTPDMTVVIREGMGQLDDEFFRNPSDQNTTAFTAPTTNPRIDCVAFDPATGGVVVFKGVEGASPVAPAVTGDRMKLAEIYHRVGESSIKDADDSTNGYISDSRAVYEWGAEYTPTNINVSGYIDFSSSTQDQWIRGPQDTSNGVQWRFRHRSTVSGRFEIARYNGGGTWQKSTMIITSGDLVQFADDVDIAGDLDVTGNLVANTGTCTFASTAMGNVSCGGIDMTGNLLVEGNTTLGNASTDTVTCVGSFKPRSVVNAPTTTPVGVLGEIAWDSTLNKHVGCVYASGGTYAWTAMY